MASVQIVKTKTRPLQTREGIHSGRRSYVTTSIQCLVLIGRRMTNRCTSLRQNDKGRVTTTLTLPLPEVHVVQYVPQLP